jgi:putative aldouronate transport system substrate-binding protein
MGDISAATGLALDFVVPSANTDTQLSFHLINNDLPDIISVVDADSIKQLANSEKVWKLDEFLRLYRPDSHILKDFPEDAKKTLIERDGAWYAYPSHLYSMDARSTWKGKISFYDEVSDYSSNNAIIWNKSIMEEFGLSVDELQTDDQVLNAFKKVKGRFVNGKEIIPLLLDGKDYYESTQNYLLSTFGAEYVNGEGNYQHVMLQPEARQALYFINLCLRNEYADPEQLMYENVKVKEYIAGGRVLCFIGNIANTDKRSSEWVSTGVILSSKGDSPVFGINMGAIPNWTGWIHTFISKSCENPKEIAAWLDYVTSEEGLLFMVFWL